MNKKLATLLFVLAATVFNLVITLGLAWLFLFVGFRLLPAQAPSFVAPLIMVASVALAMYLAFVLYRFAIKKLDARFNFEKHFDPIFGPRKPGRR